MWEAGYRFIPFSGSREDYAFFDFLNASKSRQLHVWSEAHIRNDRFETHVLLFGCLAVLGQWAGTGTGYRVFRACALGMSEDFRASILYGFGA